MSHSYTLDDVLSITSNKLVVKGIDGIPEIIKKSYMYGSSDINYGSYRPLPLVIFAVLYDAFGEAPFVNHLFNVILYALSCFLLYYTIKRIFRETSDVFAFLVSILFVVHPIHTEVVASVKSIDELLSFFFLMISLLFLHKHIDSKKMIFLGFALGAYFLSLVSKENGLVFILGIPIIFYFFSDVKVKKNLVLTLPFFIVALFYLGLRMFLLDELPTSEEDDVINNVLFGANSFEEKYATIAYVMLDYLRLLVFPYPLSWDYSFNQVPLQKWLNVHVILSIIVYLSGLVFVVKKAKEKNVFAFSILLFLLTIALVSNVVVEFGATMAERFLFLPSLAFCIALAYAIMYLFEKNERKRNNASIKLLPFILILIGILIYSVQTFTRNKVWKDNITLFRSGVDTSPNSARAHFCLGYEHFSLTEKTKNKEMKQNYYRIAIRKFDDAIRIYPRYVEAWKDKGFMHYLLKEYDLSIACLRKAVSLNGKLYDAYYYMGIAYSQKSMSDSALYFFSKAVMTNSSYAEAYMYRGREYSRMSDKKLTKSEKEIFIKKAFNQFDEALRINPKLSKCYFEKGYNYGKINDFPNAIQQFEKYLLYRPNDIEAINFIGKSYGIIKDYPNSIKYFEKSMKLQPKNVNTYINLAITYKNSNETRTAFEYVEKGLKIQPSNAALLSLREETKSFFNK